LPAAEGTGSRFLAITNLGNFAVGLNESGEPELLSPWMRAPDLRNTSSQGTSSQAKRENPNRDAASGPCNLLLHLQQKVAEPAPDSPMEIIVSWNVELPPGALLETAVRARVANRPTRFYSLGRWSAEPSSPHRHSIRDQADADGEVRTDVLLLHRPARCFQLRLRFGGMPPAATARVKFVGLCFSPPDGAGATAEAVPAARGRVLDVPTRSQLSYPGGGGWCSPTSLSMLLSYWAAKLQQPDLDWDVPRVAAGVHDPQWPGTGNWAFNVALAGSFPGMRACVTRLAAVEELEHWIAAGVPVAASVSYAVLQGRAREPDDGHLVVCVGFEQNGDVVLNDPGTTRRLRRSFSRADFATAWRCSGNTVYLIHPEAWPVPENRWGHW